MTCHFMLSLCFKKQKFDAKCDIKSSQLQKEWDSNLHHISKQRCQQGAQQTFIIFWGTWNHKWLQKQTCDCQGQSGLIEKHGNPKGKSHHKWSNVKKGYEWWNGVCGQALDRVRRKQSRRLIQPARQWCRIPYAGMRLRSRAKRSCVVEERSRWSLICKHHIWCINNEPNNKAAGKHTSCRIKFPKTPACAPGCSYTRASHRNPLGVEGDLRRSHDQKW